MLDKAPRIANVTRSLQIVHLLLWLSWAIYRERRRMARLRQSGCVQQPVSEALIRVLIHFRNSAPKLGTLMIKLGQFLSLRVDLLPEQALAILQPLQDGIPPASFEYVVALIEAELGKPVEEVFSVLEPGCIAAASLGQVHKAVLAATGDVVAVKVQRPDIEYLIRMDLRTLKFVIWIINHLFHTHDLLDLNELLAEFERIVYDEIDYLREAINARKFRDMFKDNASIYIPRVYDQYVSRRVLVIEWIDGIKINDYAALDAAGVDRLAVVKCTVCAYFYQFFEAGFFHADPHPGNIFVKAGSTGQEPVIAFIDFGMTGSHTKSIKKSLRDAFLAFIMRDARLLINALGRLGFIGERANRSAMEQSLAVLIEQYHGLTLADMHKIDMVELVQEVLQLFRGQPFHIPAQFAFTGRAVSTLAALSTELAPEFNFVEVAIPYAKAFLGLSLEDVEQGLYQVGRQLLDTGKVLLTLPRTLEQVLDEIKAGRIAINGRSQSSQHNSFVLLLMFVFSLLCGTLLMMNAHQLVASWFCFGLGSLVALRLLFKN
ncbi:ABC1 kinase family protein [Dictyobacter formicarum]|uniref:Protein kinase domain-containing protein n=1 Tax=Dictyobacter formicarum TaxID=2778368 RepID=A0ABQ3VTI7_9CHLR|nr:AarF/UbiB family protein [Dictyobacter formicarum]GHO89545.1 hypothetical protein KSZ_75510 [Dictyobacter formicarum]